MNIVKEQWLILIATPIYIIMIGAEILLSHWQHRNNYTIKNVATNCYLMLLNGGIDVAFRIVYLGVLQWFYLHAFVRWPHPWVYWLLLLLTEDLLYYWLHRFDHQIRFFWATHVTHHSAQVINFTVGFRSSVFQPLYRFIYFIPLAILGFAPVDIVFIYAVTQIWGIFVHTELIDKMGWLEYVLVTPSHHRVHHASNPQYLDKNMGMFLIVWDKLFGTFQPELPPNQYQKLTYGLTQNLVQANAATIVLHEWMQMWRDALQPNITFKQRCLYVWGPPGYSHDGSRKTSKQMLAAEKGQSW